MVGDTKLCLETVGHFSFIWTTINYSITFSVEVMLGVGVLDWHIRLAVFLSATMIKFSIPIFLHFRTQRVFLKYLAKFQSTTNSITHVLMTINVENCTNLWAKAFVILMRTSMLIVIIISTGVVFLRKWRHFLQFSTQTWDKEN